MRVFRDGCGVTGDSAEGRRVVNRKVLRFDRGPGNISVSHLGMSGSPTQKLRAEYCCQKVTTAVGPDAPFTR